MHPFKTNCNSVAPPFFLSTPPPPHTHKRERATSRHISGNRIYPSMTRTEKIPNLRKRVQIEQDVRQIKLYNCISITFSFDFYTSVLFLFHLICTTIAINVYYIAL